MKTRLAAIALIAFALVSATALPASAAGSDGPIPYTVTASGLTLAAGDTFPDGGHVNIRYTDSRGAAQSASVHFESQNNQPSGAFIDTSYLPWSYLISSPSYCITWVQVSLYEEHFGEGGQAPVCSSMPTVVTGQAKFETLTCDPASRNWVSLPAVDGGVWTFAGSSLPIGTGYAGLPTGTGPFTFTLADGSSTDLFDVTPWSDVWSPTDASALVCATTPPVEPPVTAVPPVIEPPVSTPTPTPTATPAPTATPTATPTALPTTDSTTIIEATPTTPEPTIAAQPTSELASTGFTAATPIAAALAGGLLLLGASLLVVSMYRRKARERR